MEHKVYLLAMCSNKNLPMLKVSINFASTMQCNRSLQNLWKQGGDVYMKIELYTIKLDMYLIFNLVTPLIF